MIYKIRPLLVTLDWNVVKFPAQILESMSIVWNTLQTRAEFCPLFIYLLAMGCGKIYKKIK